MEFCVKIYDKTKNFPKEEIYGITSQLRRAATSIPLNIAEGSGCKTRKEFIQFLYIALRSQYEVVTIIKLSHKLDYFNDNEIEILEHEIDEIGKLLQGLINSLQKSNN